MRDHLHRRAIVSRVDALRAVTIVIAALGTLAGCNMPGVAAPVPNPDTATAAHLPGTETAPAPPDNGSVDSGTPVMQAAIPEGWVESVEAQSQLTVYHPPGWEIIPVSAHKLDLQDADGKTWVEIVKLTPETAPEWGLNYTTGASGNEILTTLVEASQEDAEWSELTSAFAQDGREIWFAEGTNSLLGQRVWLGIQAGDEHAVIMLGHYDLSEGEVGWPDGTSMLFQTMFTTVTSSQSSSQQHKPDRSDTC